LTSSYQGLKAAFYNRDEDFKNGNRDVDYYFDKVIGTDKDIDKTDVESLINLFKQTFGAEGKINYYTGSNDESRWVTADEFTKMVGDSRVYNYEIHSGIGHILN
jgi:hypothetical protein